MSIRVTAIGFSVLVGLANAQAQNAAKPSRLAAVDASGHIRPLETPAASIERIDAKTMAPDDARALVVRIATEEHFDPDFVQSVAKVESHFNSIALSAKGAFGLMQLLPVTALRFKVDLCDPADNVRGGVRFLRTLHEKYQNPFFMLAAYNAGEDAVEKSRGVPPFPETVRFVAQVINDFYTWPAPGSGAGRALRDRKDNTPDLIEPAAPSRATARAPPQSGSQARWNNGFVMHVD